MDFFRADFLTSHIRKILEFYEPHLIDSSGGFFQNYRDDGTVFDPRQRHLVSSCRMVFNFCKAYELFREERYREYAEHGFHYLRSQHWDPVRQAFNWTLTEGHRPDDQTNHCYGLAFVILAAAAARQINLTQADEVLERAWSIMETRLWQPDAGIYADEATPDWREVAPYRGQNANMHACEALIAAYETTENEDYLDRAVRLAKRIVVDLTEQSDGLVWEHFTPALDIDWSFNKDDPKNLYRPWGFQPGHQTEWAKLLLILHGHRSEAWMIERAQQLFDRALSVCWDSEHHGIFYGFAPDLQICDSEKYFWVQAETFAASARLFIQTKEQKYLDWYHAIWDYAWAHMVDHEFGAWYRVLRSDNTKLSNKKSTAGGKCDYHTIGACWDVLRAKGALTPDGRIDPSSA